MTADSASAVTNRKWVLKARPKGAFEPARDAELVEEIVDVAGLELEEKQVLLRVEMLSVDAFVRTLLDGEAYHGKTEIGDTMPALGFGTVVKSGKGGPKVGAQLMGMVRAQTLGVCSVGGEQGLQPMLPTLGMPQSSSLGLLGITTGMTAYVGVFSVLKPPVKGETVVVSAAAGAVGNIAAQLAKSTGARVIGIAGGDKKCGFLRDELQLDGVVDYKDKSASVAEQLDKLCPDGINFFFDLVGGDILDDVLLRIAPKGRVIICGAISQYSGNLNVGTVQGPTNYLKLAERGATMAGFNVLQYLWSWPMGFWTLRTYYARGLLKIHEAKLSGIERFAGALEGLFTGAQIGKTVVDLTDAPASKAS